MPKRARHTATVSRPGSLQTEKKVILSYGRDDARSYYEQEGYVVRSVVKGDLVNFQHKGGWRVNLLNLREACLQLGVQWPVQIKQTGSKGGRAGAHRVRRDSRGNPYHVITAKNYHDAGYAGEVIWHELTHAAQAEELSTAIGALPGSDAYTDAWNYAYRGIRPNSGRKRGSAYRTRSWEVEANANMPRNADMPLARR